MPVLQPSEYDASYFDGASQALAHNAGYSAYKRWPRIIGDDAESANEHFKDIAKKASSEHSFVGDDVLEIGCAKGFVVEDLRALGVNATGIDVSVYAISQASAEVAPFVSVANALTDLSNYSRNQFNTVFSMRFLECVDDVNLLPLILEMNRISRRQIHWIDEQPNPAFYNVKSLLQWETLGFAKKTLLISRETNNSVIK